MKLKDLLKVCNHEMYIRQDLEIGVSGSEPVFHYHLTSEPIPEKLLEREVKYVQPSPVERYGRPGACLSVHLVGWEKQ